MSSSNYPPNFGGPDDWDPRYIPSGDELHKAALRALHQQRAFVLLHRDQPQVIAEQLIDIADVVRAASQIKGTHQAMAIKLGLELSYAYWLNQGRLDEWPSLLLPLLSTARDIRSRELESRIYQSWGTYLYLNQGQPQAEEALESALYSARHSGRDDLQLLARVERYNTAISRLSLEEAETQSAKLLADAKRLSLDYAQARVYFSLARAYTRAMRHQQAFAYAQHALGIFMRLSEWGFVAEAVSEMLGSLQVHGASSATYREQLLQMLGHIASRSPSPWFRLIWLFQKGTFFYHAGDYDQARDYLVRAWAGAHKLHQITIMTRIRHMLGLILSKQRCWGLARLRLLSAARGYERLKEGELAVSARHALAYIPFEQGHFALAIEQLTAVLCLAESLPESAARERLIQLIAEDIESARSRLGEA